MNKAKPKELVSLENEARLVAAQIIQQLWTGKRIDQLRLLQDQIDASVDNLEPLGRITIKAPKLKTSKVLNRIAQSKDGAKLSDIADFELESCEYGRDFTTGLRTCLKALNEKKDIWVVDFSAGQDWDFEYVFIGTRAEVKARLLALPNEKPNDH